MNQTLRIAVTVLGLVGAFLFGLSACGSKPIQSKLEPLDANRISKLEKFGNMEFAQVDQHFSQEVENTWETVLGAKMGLQTVGQEVLGLEMIRQFSQYKIILTTRSSGECVFTGYQDDNSQDTKWRSGTGKNANCQKLQILGSKFNHRYFLKIKGFAGFQLPIRALIVDQKYEAKDMYGYSVQANKDVYKSFGENYVKDFLKKGPLNIRISKIYLPKALHLTQVRGFYLLHKHFNYFSHRQIKENSIVPIEWSVNVDVRGRRTASDFQAKIEKMQLHYYGRDPLAMIDQKQDLWIKFGSNGGFNTVIAYKQKK